jgi:acetyl esterase/lipase
LALLNYLNMYIKNEDGSHIIPLPRAAALFSPWLDLSCSSKSWLENSGLDFLPANASNLHAPILPNLQHPVYSYCFGEQGGRYIDILSPKSSKPTNRIPSIGANLSALSELALPQPLLRMYDDTFVEQDQELVKSKLRAEEKDALERFVRHPLVSPIFGDFTNMPPMLVQVGECELLRDENLALAFRYQSANKKSGSSWIRHELYKDMVHNFQLGSIWIPQAKLAIKSFSNFAANVYGDSETPPFLNFEEQNMIQIIDSRFEKKRDI